MRITMRKRGVVACDKEILAEEEPPRKKQALGLLGSNGDGILCELNCGNGIKDGQILTDLCGKQWKLGKAIGQGGFGEIFLVSDKIDEDVGKEAKYVAKIENFKNGPLFVEINCYLRMGKEDMINEWKQEKGLKSLGVPHYVASGSHLVKGEKFRFLILPRYSIDLEEILISKGNVFNLKTVLTIASQIMDILEYIHSKGIVHSDIKASNILVEKRINNNKKTIKRGRKRKIIHNSKRDKEEDKDQDQIYLLDYGLGSRFIKESGHRIYRRDERNAHAGTILFCSVDAHNGSTSRRSDLECLGYNLIYWLTGSLPWIEDIKDPNYVKNKKKTCLIELKQFLNTCFNENCPRFIYEYFKYLSKLKFETLPDYKHLKTLFNQALLTYGYKNNNLLDFDLIQEPSNNTHNFILYAKKLKKEEKKRFFEKRMPLCSNSPIKPPLLRKGVSDSKKLHWSKLLKIDPELLLKQANKERERKYSDNNNGENKIDNLNLRELKPTYHMLNVYNKYMDKANNSSNNNSLNNSVSFEGGLSLVKEDGCNYTAPMIEILNRIKERQLIEEMMEIEAASSAAVDNQQQQQMSTRKNGGGGRKYNNNNYTSSSAKNNHKLAASSSAAVVTFSPRKTRSKSAAKKAALQQQAIMQKRKYQFRG